MDLLRENEDTLRRCVDRYNEGTARWVDEFYSDGARWTELPTPYAPRGRRGGRDALRDKAAAELGAFPDRRMTILNALVQRDQVLLELEWRGTARTQVGPIAAGTAIAMRIASVFTLAGGKVVAQVDYVTSATPAA
jgi:ketosteroid isomerase-like protein